MTDPTRGVPRNECGCPEFFDDMHQLLDEQLSADECARLRSHAAVSYTHLDVYKRQHQLLRQPTESTYAFLYPRQKPHQFRDRHEVPSD